MESKLIYAFLLLMVMHGEAFSQNLLKVDVAANCKNVGEINLTATNEGAYFKIHESQLPWNSSGSIISNAYEVEDGASIKLKNVSVVADYLDEVAFASGQSRSGRIRLKSRFLDFGENNNADYFIFFNFEKNLGVGNFALKGGRGVIFIPKKGLLGRACPTVVYEDR
ncbi:hypothetical protein JR064_08220 [Xanthomonas sp. CFBP 8703]|uniref:Uncharacterized protein n=1 Tax=Xanthomonas bonasiae TaxID=2810351 RepID=A0ABS3B1R6_9XANT|nr:hypothetical protein [Xanthomonas bonasiae]MBN6102146.1 hypothetical protein [Xanthomonas bonasiae]MBN6110304.1 hypothetical protein [Xanthomonas bonasiae]